jgi:DNA polymerase/3'-5' exonuclease PolX
MSKNSSKYLELKDNPNEKILNLYKKLLKKYELEYLKARSEGQTKDATALSFKVQNTRRIISILKKFPVPITNSDQIKGLPGIGKGTVTRIDEILSTGTLEELGPVAETNDIVEAILELQKIINIGETEAKRLVLNHGIYSVKDLEKAVKEKKIILNDKILFGLKYYDKIKRDIPRTEIDQYQNIFIDLAHAIDPKLEVIICGSYRRGKPTSGDIDVLLIHPDVITEKDFINRAASGLPNYIKAFTLKMHKAGILMDDMTSRDVLTKYMGVCQLKKNPLRRIDVRILPYESRATALCYFTGPDTFNRYMRQKADKMGYILNEYGLYERINGENGKEKIKGKRIPKGKRIVIKTEEELFKKLGMKYLTPEEREQFVG